MLNNNMFFKVIKIVSFSSLMLTSSCKENQSGTEKPQSQNGSMENTLKEERKKAIIDVIATTLLAMNGEECFTWKGLAPAAFYRGILFSINLKNTTQEFQREYAVMMLNLSKISDHEKDISHAEMNKKMAPVFRQFRDYLKNNYRDINIDYIIEQFGNFKNRSHEYAMLKFEGVENKDKISIKEEEKYSFLEMRCTTLKEQLDYLEKSNKFKEEFINEMMHDRNVSQ